MEVTRFGDAGDRDLLFVLGWGNRPGHENVRWLVDRLANAGHRVHPVRIPTVVTDFEAEYRDPLASYADGLDDYRLLSHSTGGLITAHLPTDRRRTYLSPWWGIDAPAALVAGLSRLPTTRPILPLAPDPDALGDLTTDRQLREGPDGVAPTFLREASAAQATLPPFREGSVVFCSLRDRVVDLAAVGRRAPSSNVALYDGGHELFSSSGRDEHVERVLAALESGPAALG